MNAVGAPPAITKLSWFTWYMRLLDFRVSECPLERTTDYYFAQGGNDSADGLTSVIVSNTSVTWTAATLTLSTAAGTPTTWARTPIAGEQVYVTGGSTTAGLYTVASATTNTIVLTSSCKATDGTSITVTAGPKKTISACNALINASSGDIRCRFRRGDVWREVSTNALGLVVNKANVTIDDYADTAIAQPSTRLPIITAFKTIPYTAWAIDGTHTNTWSCTIAALSGPVNSVAWVRQLHDTSSDYCYKRVASAAICDSTRGSFFYDETADKLYINTFLGDIAPTSSFTADIEYAAEVASGTEPAGIAVSDVDGCRIHGIRLDGWGVSFNDNTNKTGPFSIAITGTNACVVSSCEAYYGAQHIFIGGGGGGASGGIMTWINCKGGLGYFWQNSLSRAFQDVYFPIYTSLGGGEGICHNCIADGGRLPYSGENSATDEGAACRCHTNGGAGEHFSLMICYGLQVPASQWQVMRVGNFANPPNWVTGDLDTDGSAEATPYDLANCRGWNVNTRFYLRKPTALDATWWVANASPIGCYDFGDITTIFVNGRYECGPMMSGTASSWMYGAGLWGFHINSTFLVYADLSQAGSAGIKNTGANGAGRLYNSYLYVRSRHQSGSANSASIMLGAGIGTNDSWASSDQTSKVMNCIIHYDIQDTRATVAGLSNNLDSGGSEVADADKREKYNAYVGVTQVGAAANFYGVSNVLGVVLNPDCKPDVPPERDSNIVSADYALIEGYTLEYDQRMEPRGEVRAMGPLNPSRSPALARRLRSAGRPDSERLAVKA